MTANEAKTVIGEAIEKLRAVVQGGFQDYLAHYRENAHVHSRRTRANLIHDHMVRRGRELCHELPGLHFITKAPRNFFDLNGKLLIQFKKLDSKLLTRNYPTQLSLALEEHPRTFCLPGLRDRLPLITVGYVPSHDHTAIDGIFITYVENRKLTWYLSLNGEEDKAALELEENNVQNRRRVYAKGGLGGRREAV